MNPKLIKSARTFPENFSLCHQNQKGENMKLTILVDNNTLIDRYFLGEPAVSYYIEDENMKL